MKEDTMKLYRLRIALAATLLALAAVPAVNSASAQGGEIKVTFGEIEYQAAERANVSRWGTSANADNFIAQPGLP
jgi:hypothetical protein